MTPNRVSALSPVVVLLAAACSPVASPSPPIPSEPTPLPTVASISPLPVSGGCAGTQVYDGPGPDASIGLESNPWALATPASSGIVAYFWHPSPGLIVANEPNGGTKILWVDHDVQASTLVIDGHPAASATPAIHVLAPAASSPADNYPSSVDVPVPGCWHFDLTLGTAHATIAIEVTPAP